MFKSLVYASLCTHCPSQRPHTHTLSLVLSRPCHCSCLMHFDGCVHSVAPLVLLAFPFVHVCCALHPALRLASLCCVFHLCIFACLCLRIFCISLHFCRTLSPRTSLLRRITLRFTSQTLFFTCTH